MSDLTITKISELKLAKNDEKVEKKYFSADVSSFRYSLTRSLPKGFEEPDL